jgi:hypothetical protein
MIVRAFVIVILVVSNRKDGEGSCPLAERDGIPRLSGHNAIDHRVTLAHLDVERWTLDVERFLPQVKRWIVRSARDVKHWAAVSDRGYSK